MFARFSLVGQRRDFLTGAQFPYRPGENENLLTIGRMGAISGRFNSNHAHGRYLFSVCKISSRLRGLFPRIVIQVSRNSCAPQRGPHASFLTGLCHVPGPNWPLGESRPRKACESRALLFKEPCPAHVAQPVSLFLLDRHNGTFLSRLPKRDQSIQRIPNLRFMQPVTLSGFDDGDRPTVSRIANSTRCLVKRDLELQHDRLYLTKLTNRPFLHDARSFSVSLGNVSLANDTIVARTTDRRSKEWFKFI